MNLPKIDIDDVDKKNQLSTSLIDKDGYQSNTDSPKSFRGTSNFDSNTSSIDKKTLLAEQDGFKLKLDDLDDVKENSDENGQNSKRDQKDAKDGDGGQKATDIVKIDPQDDIPNNTDKFIDFEAQLQAYRQRNELQLPYTLTQAEDAMFIDQYNIVTLEYHYYQNDCKYSTLEPIVDIMNDEGKLVDEEGEPVEYKLGTESYNLDEENIHPMSAFARSGVTNFFDCQDDIVNDQRNLKSDEKEFFTVDNSAEKNLKKKMTRQITQMFQQRSASKSPSKSRSKTPQRNSNSKSKSSKKKKVEHTMLEGIVALYKVTPNGGMQRNVQANVNMGRNYYPSKDGNMVLTRSKDKKLISLTNFNRNDPNKEYFKIQAWNIKLKEYTTLDNFQRLNAGLSLYYENHADEFERLIEIAFVGGGKFVQLTYVESKERDLQQQQDYELLMQQKQEKILKEMKLEGKDTTDTKTKVFDQRDEPRKARKHVFFNINTGNIVFEYGGIQTPIETTNSSGKTIKVYELGCLVKEIREEQFNPQICFFFAGDFIEHSVKSTQISMPWAMNYTNIGMKKLFNLDNQEDKMNLIHTHIKSIIDTPVIDGFLNYFPFNNLWIESQIFNWEYNTTIATTRKFDQIAMMNVPLDREEYNVKSYYVHGTRFREKLDLLELEKKNFIMDPPLYKKLPNDCEVRHTRNQNIKDQLYFDNIKGNIVKTYCVRMENKDPKSRVISPKIVIKDYISRQDIWLHCKKNFNTGNTDDIFQTIHISKGNQTGILQTIMPKSMKSLNCSDVDDVVERKTSQFYQQQADLPCIAYNLGDNKIVLQNTYQTEVKKKYILTLEEDEKFVCWLEFNQFGDVGFYPDGLRVECCSHFAYMTTGTNESATNSQKNQINLLFIDPFYIETQVAQFKSKTFYDHEVFTTNDTIIKSVIQSTMEMKRDRDFKTYIWTQFPQNLVKSKMLNKELGDLVDSDASEQDDLEETERDIRGRIMFEQVPLILNNRDFIYYVQKQNGRCIIKEGNPRDPKIYNHQIIYSLKADKCLTLQTGGSDSFFFMDQDFVVHHLTRSQNNRLLHQECEVTMKEIQRLDFQPVDFNNVIMNEQYAIQGNKIFYFYETSDTPFPDGILESEDMVRKTRDKPLSKHIKGPYPIKGSQRVYNVYQIEKFKSHICIILRPDSASKIVINDFQNFCDLSTFLENGYILIKIRRRYMVFNSNGGFIDEIDFEEPKIDVESESNLGSGLITARHINTARNGFDELKKRRKEDPILDFQGNEYKFKSIPSSPPLTQSNKLELLNMSYNNKWFLFYNRMEEALFIYELVTVPPKLGENKPTFVFRQTYQLDSVDTFMFQHMNSVQVDPVAYFRANISQIEINDNACVKLCYIENMPLADVASEDDDGDDIRHAQLRLIGAIFTPKDGETKMQSQCYTQFFEFPRNAQENLAEILKKRKKVLDRKIKSISTIQARLPKSLQDYSQYENLIDDLILLEAKKPDHVFAKVFCDNLLILYCGKYVQYARLIPNKKKTKKSPKEVMDLTLQPFKNKKKSLFEDMDLDFAETVEVIKVCETTTKNVLQVVTVDHSDGTFTILTWNFDDNVQMNIYQTRPHETDDVGYHVVRGMNFKMNYMLNQHHLIDLETNIPLRQTSVNQELDPISVSYSKQLIMLKNVINQRKIYQDGMKFLGVEKPASLFYPLSRIDLLLWLNIHQLGEDPEFIQESCSIENCNIVVDGVSLLHYFADNADLIEKIQLMYETAKDNGTLSESDATLPLQILNPDNDGRTALFRAVSQQSPKSFQCMVEMLIDFPEQCISRMMLRSLALVLSHEADSVINYFGESIFKPPQMQIEQFLPWNDDLDEFVFPSHTSVISKSLLYKELNKQGIETPSGSSNQKGKGKVDKDAKIDTMKRRHDLLVNKRNLRPQVLLMGFDNGLAPGEKELKRVQLEALDFDWLFEGENAKALLRLLATEANNQCLTKKSIRIFVDLMWSYYQPAIIRNIFIPYVIYLIALSLCAASVTGDFLRSIASKNNSDEDYAWYYSHKIAVYICAGVADFLLLFFMSIELPQLIRDPRDYFKDPWNCIDFISIAFNTLFMATGSYCILTEHLYFKVSTIYSFGSFACFFMWIKVFYWMRLFKELAYYVKLIQQTLYDSLPFMVMVAIIILAFGNYFYVINTNLQKNDGLYDAESSEEEEADYYFDSYYSNAIGDVLVSIYLMGALGDFDSDLYTQGRDKYAAMSMFLLASFIITVVFMNMLIAIMGETFGQVLETSVESGIREQVVLIADHSWLLNLKSIFKGKRYIIRVTPSIGAEGSSDPQIDSIKSSNEVSVKKITRMSHQVTTKLDNVDVNTRFMLALQEKSIQQAMRKITNFEKKYVENITKEESESDEDPVIAQANKVQKQKKKDILEFINAQINSQKITVDNIQQVAMDWMAIADQDGSGELDIKEFSEFFGKIEGLLISQDEIQQIFDDFDGSGNGSLSVEEFARAIYMNLLADNDEYSDQSN